MTTIGGAGSFPYDEAGVFLGEDGHYYYYEDFAYEPDAYERAPGRQIDGITIVAVGLILVIAIGILFDQKETMPISAAPPISAVAEQPIATALPAPPPQPTVAPVAADDPAAIIMPYDDYILTQGLHGQSYGHLAIDIKAGEGAPIKSPIEGVVTELFTDGVGNPTIVIENDVYKVTMLHGVYTMAVGDAVKMGQPVGTESNLGNTRDGLGRSCRGRDCGYHTHLNIFDKRSGANVNPLELLGIRLSR